MFLVLQNQILISFIRAELFYLSEALLTSVEVQTDLSENTKICLLNLEKEKKKTYRILQSAGKTLKEQTWSIQPICLLPYPANTETCSGKLWDFS